MPLTRNAYTLRGQSQPAAPAQATTLLGRCRAWMDNMGYKQTTLGRRAMGDPHAFKLLLAGELSTRRAQTLDDFLTKEGF